MNEEKEAVFKLFLQDFLKNEDFLKLIYAKLRTMAVVDKDGYAKSKDDFLKNMERQSIRLRKLKIFSLNSSFTKNIVTLMIVKHLLPEIAPYPILRL